MNLRGIFFVFLALTGPSQVTHGESAAARVVSINGVATVLGKVLHPGARVGVGSVVRTGEATSLKLLLADDSIVDLGPNAQFVVEKMDQKAGTDREVSLRLDLGKARTSIQKKLNRQGKFLIRTKASVLAVRGTEILMDVGGSGGPGQESVTVVSGRVDMSFLGKGNARVELGRGQQIRFNRVAAGGGRFRAASPVLNNPRAMVKPVRQLASVVRQFRGPDVTLRNQVEVKEQGGGSTLNLASNRMGKYKGGPGGPRGPLEAGETILELVPDPSGASAAGGLNQIPGGLPKNGGGGGNGPLGAGRNITLQIIFDPS